MIDIDNIYEELIIDENIPRDLYKLYDVSPYASQKNPSTIHYEVHSQSRRSKLYDYGKATYKVVSAEEALQMVKENKSEIQNLRIIFDNSLVEYEVRDNGSIYAIYRSLNPVTINGKEYKNIGFASWQAVIRAAQKIYWTDEYSKKISPEEIEKRREKEAERTIYKGITPANFTYDPHRPYDNLTRGNKYTVKNIPDTGAHLYDYEDKGRINRLYNAYDLARKAVKNLEQKKDTYSDDEYQELKTLYDERKEETLADYNNALKEKRFDDTKKIKYIPADVAKFNKQRLEYTLAIQGALSTGYELKKKLEKLLTTTVNTSTFVKTNIFHLRANLLGIIKDLEDDEQEMQNLEVEVKSENANRLVTVLTEIERYKEQFINTHLDQLASVEKDMEKVDNILAANRPNVAAKKARTDAANIKELDPELVDIIDFDNFSN